MVSVKGDVSGRLPEESFAAASVADAGMASVAGSGTVSGTDVSWDVGIEDVLFMSGNSTEEATVAAAASEASGTLSVAAGFGTGVAAGGDGSGSATAMVMPEAESTTTVAGGA